MKEEKQNSRISLDIVKKQISLAKQEAKHNIITLKRCSKDRENQLKEKQCLAINDGYNSTKRQKEKLSEEKNKADLALKRYNEDIADMKTKCTNIQKQSDMAAKLTRIKARATKVKFEDKLDAFRVTIQTNKRKSASDLRIMVDKNRLLHKTNNVMKSDARTDLNKALEEPRRLRADIRNLNTTLKHVTQKNMKFERNKELKKVALRKLRCVQKEMVKEKGLSEKRLQRLHASQDNVLELKEILDEVKNNKVSKAIRKVREEGKHGGSHTWPLWILQLVLEMLVNGTPPSAVTSNIASQIAIMNPHMKVLELPSLSYVRKCRTILRIIGETLASYRLAKAKDWQQLFTDETS